MTASPLTRDSTAAESPQSPVPAGGQAGSAPAGSPSTAAIPVPPVKVRPRYAAPLLFSAEILNIVALLAVVFVGQVTVIGRLEHARDQQVAFAQLRLDLANGTAPVGPVDPVGHRVALGRPVALLEIPGIDLKEVVLSGTTAGVLASGVGHRRDTVLPGQTGVSVLMGRRLTYGGPFSAIGTLGPGDKLMVTTGQGRSTYQVRTVRHPGDPVPPAPAQGGGRLTLITTAGSLLTPSDVVRVDADLVGITDMTTGQSAQTSTAMPAARPALTAAALPTPEKAMQGDIKVLVPLVLWGFLLVAGVWAASWVRRRWGRWQSWIVAIPTLGYLGLSAAEQVMQLLPNLI